MMDSLEFRVDCFWSNSGDYVNDANVFYTKSTVTKRIARSTCCVKFDRGKKEHVQKYGFCVCKILETFLTSRTYFSRGWIGNWSWEQLGTTVWEMVEEAKTWSSNFNYKSRDSFLHSCQATLFLLICCSWDTWIINQLINQFIIIPQREITGSQQKI